VRKTAALGVRLALVVVIVVGFVAGEIDVDKRCAQGGREGHPKPLPSLASPITAGGPEEGSNAEGRCFTRLGLLG
jgi:hypothetical protein